MAKDYDGEKFEYEYEPHHFVKRKLMPWQFCQKCGLVTLNNPFTRWSIDKGCNSRFHPSYEHAKKKYTALR